MLVPNISIPTPHRLRRTGLACLLLLATVPSFARGPELPLRIPLQGIGFQPLASQFLLNGSSMLTLHYVDDKHILLTFVVHRLIPRQADDPEDDQDRTVDAVLLELPSGRVLTRTSWHLHDQAQYLWNLGHGHFLLRIRDTLTTFAPLANLASSDPFIQHPFFTSSDRRIAALLLTPDADLLTIESIKRIPVAKMPKTPLFGPAQTRTPRLDEQNPVQINFYRIRQSDDGGPVQSAFAGTVLSRGTGDIPATGAGYLSVVDQGRQHWAFDFHSYAGKVAELSPFDSSCSPAPVFVSRSEFIAFGCRGGPSMQQIGGFNMRGEEMWEQGLFGDFIAPSIAFAPASGRFALSRLMLRVSAVPDQPVSADEVSSQTVVVYQTGTGKQLLRAECSPVERAGQNFALSPNGLALAVVHADAIEIYNLPPLTDKDAAALKLAQASAPAENDLPVRFASQAQTQTQNAPSSAGDSPATPGPQPAAATTANTLSTSPDAGQPASPTQSGSPVAVPTPQTQPAATQTPASQSEGDTPPEQHRAPPTLYTLPDDKAPARPKDTPQ
jgi:hypothetical protein